MSKVLVVTGSVRKGNVNSSVVERVVNVIKDKGAEAEVANLSELNLPFIDSPVHPSSPDFVPEHESVKEWTKLVADSDGVVFVSPEYNHNPSPVQMNAVDWISKEWRGKPVALVGYGATSGGTQALAHLREGLMVVLKARVGTQQANLFFGRDLGYDGAVLDEAAVDGKIGSAVDELLETITKYA